MALVTTIATAEDLRNAMFTDRRNYYTYEGYEALVDYFNEFSENVEFDCIAICCDFTEESPEYIADNYGYTVDGMPFSEAIKSGCVDRDELVETFVNDYLNYHTWAVLLSNGNVLYQEF